MNEINLKKLRNAVADAEIFNLILPEHCIVGIGLKAVGINTDNFHPVSYDYVPPFAKAFGINEEFVKAIYFGTVLPNNWRSTKAEVLEFLDSLISQAREIQIAKYKKLNKKARRRALIKYLRANSSRYDQSQNKSCIIGLGLEMFGNTNLARNGYNLRAEQANFEKLFGLSEHQQQFIYWGQFGYGLENAIRYLNNI